MKKYFSGLVLTGMLVSSVVPTSFAMEPQTFSDVPQGSEYYDAVGYLKTQGVIDGYPDGTFKPYQTINRAEFTKIIMGANGYKLPASPDKSLSGLKFKDIENGAWYNPYLREAVTKDVIGGYPDGTFKPAQEINFAEASKIIVVADGGDFAGAGYAPEDWFHKYVNVLENIHAIPITINTFDQQITRGEMAEIIYRMKAGKQDLPSTTYELLAVPKGYISGSLGYPSEGIPADMKVCADNIELAETFCTYDKITSSQFTYGLGYKLPVKPGSYNVYAVVGATTGLYSEFVPCGLSVNCTSHKSIQVDVNEGQTVKGIDPIDWYHN